MSAENTQFNIKADEERFIVFQKNGLQSEWEQESISLSFERAKVFKARLQKTYPERCYYIMTAVKED